jgi:hypothetical protein
VLGLLLLLGDGSPELSPESRLVFDGIGMSKFKGVVDDLDFFSLLPRNILAVTGGLDS